MKRKLKFRWLIVMLSVLAFTFMVFGFTACETTPRDDTTHQHTFDSAWTSDGDYHWHAATCGDDEIGEKAAHDWVIDASKSTAATCAAAGENVYKCSVCAKEKKESLVQLSHDWVIDSSKSTAATCAAAGENVFKCSHCEQEKKETLVQLTHDWVIDSSKSTAATCMAEGENVFKCSHCKQERTETLAQLPHVWSGKTETKPTCSSGGYSLQHCTNEGCDAEQKTDLTNALGHKFSEPTCTEAAVCQREGCEEQGEAAFGHTYVLSETEHQEATCTENGFDVYRCRDCDAHYKTDIVALGHIITWQEETTKEPATESDVCCYIVKTGECANCDDLIEEKTPVKEHHYISSGIETYATCTEAGTKLFTCTNCDEHTTEPYEDADAHSWNEGVTQNNITTYICAHNREHTKTAVVYTETSATVAVDTLKEAGSVTLGGTSIQLDDAAQGVLEGKTDVTMGADTLAGEDLEAALGALGKDANDPLLKGTVYNLTMTDGDTPITNFDGKVTVTIPYVLSENENPDQIVICYINGTEVEEVIGKYSNGYVIFETTHFSYYTVTRMSPAERCKQFGHNYTDVHKDPDCLLNGYDMKLCTRCGDTEKTILPALGHDWQVKSETPATCTENGSTVNECKVCEASYTVTTAATGHDWQVETVNATCEAAGHTKGTCSVCQEKYTVTLPQKAHSYTRTVKEATCTEAGYTSNVCVYCGFELLDDHTDALGHDPVDQTVDPTCTEEGYTISHCERCGVVVGEKKDIKDALGHNMENGVCSRCGEGCTHNYVAGQPVVPTCTEGGYTLYTCSNCSSSYKSDVKDPLGHSFTIEECTRCHAPNPEMKNYYMNLLGNGFSGSFSLTFSDFSFEIKETDGENETVYGKVQQVDVIELSIALSGAGELIGAGKGKVSVEGEGFDEALEVSVEFYIKEGLIYVFLSSDNADMVPTAVEIVSFDFVLAQIAPGMDYETFKEYVVWLNTKVKTVTDEIKNANAEVIANSLGTVLRYFFTRTQEDEKYIYRLNYDAVKTLNDTLYETSVGTLFDSVFGAGSYDKIPALLTGILSKTPSEAITLLEGYGLNLDTVCGAVDSLMLLMRGEAIDSKAMLEEMLKEMVTEDGTPLTIGEILTASGTEIDVATLAEQLVLFKDLTPYQIITLFAMGSQEESAVKQLYDTVTAMLDVYLPMVKEGLKVSFITDDKGNLISFSLEVNVEDLPVPTGGGSGEVEKPGVPSEKAAETPMRNLITLGGKITLDYGVEVKVDEDKIESAAKLFRFEANKTYELYGEEHYDYFDSDNMVNLHIFESYSKASMNIVTDANGSIKMIRSEQVWTYRQIIEENDRYFVIEERKAQAIGTFVFDGTPMLQYQKGYCGKLDRIDIMAYYVSESVTTTQVHYFSRKTGEIIRSMNYLQEKEPEDSRSGNATLLYNAETKKFTLDDPHNWDTLEVDETKSKIECGGYYYYACKNNCGYGRKVYSDHLAKIFKTEYELAEGATDCEQGVIVKQICPECNEVVNSHTEKDHITYVKDTISLKNHGSKCDDMIDIYGCTCGKRAYYSFGEHIKNFEPRQISYRFADGKIVQGVLLTCTVSECGFRFFYYTESEKDENCLATTTATIILGVTLNKEQGYAEGGTNYGSLSDTGSSYNHSVGKEPITEGTEKAYTETWVCLDCQKTLGKKQYSLVENADGSVETSEFWNYNPDGSLSEHYQHVTTLKTESGQKKRIEEYKYFDLKDGSLRELQRTTYFYVIVGGEEYDIREERRIESGKDWEQYDYVYEGNIYCKGTCIVTNSFNGEGRQEVFENHRTTGTATEPTCTQCAYAECVFCHESVIMGPPMGHRYFQNVCVNCGLQNPVGEDGRVWMEDLSYTSKENYVIGYFDTSTSMFEVRVYLIDKTDETNINYLSDLKPEVPDLNEFGSGKITFSVADIVARAEEFGLTDYMICVRLLPLDSQGELDYSITIDAHVWQEIQVYEREAYEYYRYGEGPVPQTVTISYCEACGLVQDYGYFPTYEGQIDGVNVRFIGDYWFEIVRTDPEGHEHSCQEIQVYDRAAFEEHHGDVSGLETVPISYCEECGLVQDYGYFLTFERNVNGVDVRYFGDNWVQINPFAPEVHEHFWQELMVYEREALENHQPEDPEPTPVTISYCEACGEVQGYGYVEVVDGGEIIYLGDVWIYPKPVEPAPEVTA